MMCGLQGSGKTTHSAKLGRLLKTKGHAAAGGACDIYRPPPPPRAGEVGKRRGGVLGLGWGKENQKNSAKAPATPHPKTAMTL